MSEKTISKKYKKKPVIIEAVQLSYSPYNLKEVARWCDAEELVYDEISGRECIKIRTLEGMMTGKVGDWIIKGVQGEFYPCKNDIFQSTYEAIESESE